MKEIKYIGYYATPDCTPARDVPLAGRNKMDYTIEVLSKIVDSVEIISPATITKGQKLTCSTIQQIRPNVRLRLFGNIANKNKVTAYFNFVASRLQLLCYLLRYTDKDSIVLAYHSLALIKIIRFAKRLRKFKLILELNEIYSDVNPKYEKYRKDETSIINVADAFIFPNELMSDLFNSKKRDYAVCSGIYKHTPRCSQKFKDGKIHVVYAGTLDPSKGGGAAAAAAAELPANYHIHILGFGSPQQVEDFKWRVNEIQAKSEATLSYDGVLDGLDFLTFLQKCDIGLSTQTPNAKFNDTSFPSKVLTYLANGLQVVSIDIPAISKSKLASAIKFYANQNPQDIANAIRSVTDFTPHYELLDYLDVSFESDVTNMINKMLT